MSALAARLPGRAALLALAVLLLALAPAKAASAHAVLLATDPADDAALSEAPASVTLSFNEAVRPVEDAAVLVDGAQAERALTAARDDEVLIELPADLGEGRYYLNWRVISADDHPIAGVLAFTVGDPPPGAAPAPPAAPDEPAPWPLAAATALHYLGLLVFTGLLFFRVAIARSWPGRPRHRVLAAGGAAAVAGAALTVVLGALEIAGLPLTGIADTAAWTGSVRSAAVVVLALTVLGVAAAFAAFTRGRAPWAAPVALAAGGVALAAPVLVGHSMAFGVRWVMIAADAIHLGTGAVWAGGLAGLLMTFRLWRRSGDAAEAARIVARFSACAGYSVALLGASGLVMALSVHRTWDGLVATDHGRALVVKLALVAAALALAAWNRFRLVPAVADVRTRGAGLSRLRRILTVEAAVVASAAALTGLLVNVSPVVEEPPPAAAPVGGVTSVEAELGEGRLEAHLTPGLTGENTIMLTLTDAAGLPLEPLEPPTVSAFLSEEDFGPVGADVHDLEAGKYHCVLDLPLSGTWEVTVQTRLTRYESATTVVTVDVG